LLTDFTDDDIDGFISRLEKLSPALVALIQPAVEEVKRTVQYANAAGVSRKIFLHPLMLGTHHSHFKDGVLVEVVRRGKRLDVLAAGGR
jgi:translation initiation factor 2-alpha kinase 4